MRWIAAGATLFAVACADTSDAGPVGTPEARSALFDTIVARTDRREAWSPIKNENLGFDPLESMRALRDDFIAAETDEELFYAISRISAARRDRHLSVNLVRGGLELSDSAGLEIDGADGPDPRVVPIRIFPDFGEAAGYFIGDVGAVPGMPEAATSAGDRVVALDGVPVEEWMAEATTYMRHSTTAGLRWKLAEAATQATAVLPAHLRSTGTVTVRRADGTGVTLPLPLVEPDQITWEGVSEPHYEGFERRMETVTFDLLVDDRRDIAILIWTGFRETMVADVDALMDYALERDLLDHTLVVDVTRSGGGSRGAYAVQRLQSKPFKTTFGNLRISDVTPLFVEDRQRAFAARRLTDSGVPETIDDGNWLMEWLEEDVTPAIDRGDPYTNDVPFKSAHAPKDSDGVLQPADVHFRGAFAVISGPDGGSHLDQFIHQVVDNDLGPVVGMPPGGYSNTWEWNETLTMPETGRPLVDFMWNIGHTITPAGEIAEGNPAVIDEFIPLTAENVETYYETLLAAALRHIEERR